MSDSLHSSQTTSGQSKVTFSERLTLALNKKGLSQTDLAKMLGLSRATVSRWMTDYPNLSSKKLAELAEFLDVSLNWLLLGVHTPDRPIIFDLSCEEKQLLLVLNDLEPELKEYFTEGIKQIELKRRSTLHKPRLKSDFIIRDQTLPIAIIDMEGRIIYSNKYHNNYFGADAVGGSLVNRSIYEIVPAFMHGSIKQDIHKTRFNGYSRNFKCSGKRLDNNAEVVFTVYARYMETADCPAIFSVIFPEI